MNANLAEAGIQAQELSVTFVSDQRMLLVIRRHDIIIDRSANEHQETTIDNKHSFERQQSVRESTGIAERNEVVSMQLGSNRPCHDRIKSNGQSDNMRM